MGELYFSKCVHLLHLDSWQRVYRQNTDHKYQFIFILSVGLEYAKCILMQSANYICIK